MPQFVMENTESAIREETAFVYGFIECLFFTNQASGISAADFFTPENQADIAEGRADGCLPCDVGYSDLAPDALAKIRKFCEAWQTENAALLERAYATGYDEGQAGRDFLFTHCGHGVGFSDRDELNEMDDEKEAKRDELQSRMRAEGTSPEEWGRLLSEVKALESDLAELLSDAAGHGEINPFYDESGTVGVDLY